MFITIIYILWIVLNFFYFLEITFIGTLLSLLPLSPSLLASVLSPISCPHTEERLFSEEEEARASRFKEFQGNHKSVSNEIARKLERFGPQEGAHLSY